MTTTTLNSKEQPTDVECVADPTNASIALTRERSHVPVWVRDKRWHRRLAEVAGCSPRMVVAVERLQPACHHSCSLRCMRYRR